MLCSPHMIRRITKTIKDRISSIVHQKRRQSATFKNASRASKNDAAMETAAQELISRYGEALKSLSTK